MVWPAACVNAPATSKYAGLPEEDRTTEPLPRKRLSAAEEQISDGRRATASTLIVPLFVTPLSIESESLAEISMMVPEFPTLKVFA